MERSTTSARLKEIMKERGLKQIDILNLAKPYCNMYNIKLNKSDLSQFISGKVVPGQWKLTILGLALDVDEAWLMGYNVSPERQSSPPKAAPPKNDSLLSPADHALLDAYHRADPADRTAVDAILSKYAAPQAALKNA